MGKEKKAKQQETPVPFNEALKRLWASPPQHKTAKKKSAIKKKVKK